MTKVTDHAAINFYNPGVGYACEGGEIVEWGDGPIPTQAQVDQWENDYAARLAGLAYRDARAADYAQPRSAGGLSGGRASQVEAIGDTLDTLIQQVEAMRLELNAAATGDWTDLLNRIQAIKTRHPKG